MPYSLLEAKPIEELCRVVDCEHKTAPYVEESEYLVVRTSNVRNSQLVMDDIKYTTLEGYKEWTSRAVPEYGDVLFTREAPAGESCLVPKDKKVCMGQRMVMLRPKPSKVDPVFLSMILNTERTKNDIYRLSIGSTVSRINIADIKKLKVASPPLPEQQKIAKILTSWDKAIDTTERLIDNSKQQKKALMQQLLTGKKCLLNDEGKRFEGEWKEYKLKDVAKIIVSPVDKKTVEGEIPVELCNYTDVYYNIRITKSLDFMKATAKQSEIDRFTLQVDDVIITKDSETPEDIAVPALVSEDLNGVVCGYHLAIIRPNKDKVIGAFLNYLFATPKIGYYFFSLANGATRFGLTIGSIEQAQFKLPSLAEQQKIAAALTNADKEIDLLEQQLADLQQEKKALMQVLLTGKKGVVVGGEIM